MSFSDSPFTSLTRLKGDFIRAGVVEEDGEGEMLRLRFTGVVGTGLIREGEGDVVCLCA